ncbi:Uncharacterised protein [Bordetella pertussis]|nr:Uncharacterised protein [Bordetella pertussis]
MARARSRVNRPRGPGPTAGLHREPARQGRFAYGPVLRGINGQPAHGAFEPVTLRFCLCCCGHPAGGPRLSIPCCLLLPCPPCRGSPRAR